MPSSACPRPPRHSPPFPTRRSSDLTGHAPCFNCLYLYGPTGARLGTYRRTTPPGPWIYEGGRFWDFKYQEADELPVFDTEFGKLGLRSEEHTSELQSPDHLVCRLLLALAPPATLPLSLHDALPISPGTPPASTVSTSTGRRARGSGRTGARRRRAPGSTRAGGSGTSSTRRRTSCPCSTPSSASSA